MFGDKGVPLAPLRGPEGARGGGAQRAWVFLLCPSARNGGAMLYLR